MSSIHTNLSQTTQMDYLVIGSGVAGLYFALKAAQKGKVLLVTKRAPQESNTLYAQGGIAAVLDSDDSFETHIKDTLAVGDGLCHPDIVRTIVADGPRVVNELFEKYAV